MLSSPYKELGTSISMVLSSQAEQQRSVQAAVEKRAIHTGVTGSFLQTIKPYYLFNVIIS